MNRPIKRKKYCFVAALLFSVALLAGVFVLVYKDRESMEEEKKLLAVTSFYPVYITTANIVGDCKGISVKNLSEPQTGCLHDFQLTPEDMKLLSSADVFLVNGGGMESFLGDVAKEYPDLVVLETAKGLALSEDNAHVWMSVTRCRKQAEAIAQQLCELAPEYERELKENAAEYDKKLELLIKQQEEIKKAAKGQKIVSFHDAYAYLADDYGFEIAYTLNLDEERQVSAKEAADVLFAVEKEGVSILFAEELYGRELADTIKKEAGIDVFYLDTLVRGDEELNSYIDGMQRNLAILKTAFGV